MVHIILLMIIRVQFVVIRVSLSFSSVKSAKMLAAAPPAPVGEGSGAGSVSFNCGKKYTPKFPLLHPAPNPSP
jgi:hypothetical protein